MVIAIGASTGGTEAIASVIRQFDTDIPGIVMVQHMPAGFTTMYAERLERECRITVKEAKTGDRVVKGQALLAPASKQMKLKKQNGIYTVECREAPRVSGHCPSVDVLFDSVAEQARAEAIGIILTGMGADGAKGLLHMREEGAETIGQSEESCVVYGMPKAAYEMGAVKYQVSLKEIPAKVYELLRRFPSNC